jgi:hypothetical protein
MDAKRRLALFYGTQLTTSQALAMMDSEINYTCMKTYGCDVRNVLTIIPVQEFKMRGCDVPSKLMELGMDVLDLLEPNVLREMICAYGTEAVKSSFINTHEDAVSISGTEACDMLGFTLETLLTLCKGHAHSAEMVLRNITNVNHVLPQVPIRVLLDTSIQSCALKRVGVSIETLTDKMCATSANLSALGIKLM